MDRRYHAAMGSIGRSRGRAFSRAILGYRRSAVDRYLAEVDTARRSLQSEVDRLRQAERLTRVGDDIAELLTTFADAVSNLRDRAIAETEQSRLQADAYAQQRMSEADRLYDDALRRGTAVADGLVRKAREEISTMADQQFTIAQALETAAQGIAVSRQALSQLSSEAHGAEGRVVPLAHAQRSPDGTPARTPAQWRDGLGDNGARQERVP